MTPQELKSSILQLAVQGRLVEQRPEEGTAEELYLKLLTAKNKAISIGIALKKKITKPFYTEDELSSFNIPNSWRWVQLSEVSIIQEGAGIRKWQYRDVGIQVLCVTNILDGQIDLQKKQLFISEKEYKEKYKHLTLRDGDIVTSCSGGSWGKVSFFYSEKKLMLNTSTLRLRFYEDLADNKYLYYLCRSQFFKNQLQNQLSGMQPNFGYAHYSRIMVPLPPLAEQKRIVAKIEELLPYIDRYEKAWSKLEDFNKRFPGDMQKSVLQMAIQGKLVEQRPEEGTGEELYRQIQAEKQSLIKSGKIKKEKPLPEISEDEIPFDIPESWKWVRLKNIVFNHGQIKPESPFSYIDIGSIDNKANKLNDEEQLINPNEAPSRARKKVKMGDILYSTVRPYLHNICIINREFSHTPIASTGFAVLSCYNSVYNKYLFYYLLSPSFDAFANDAKNSKGVAYPAINDKRFYSAVIAIPPLAEQKRIVQKLEQILPLCDKLK